MLAKRRGGLPLMFATAVVLTVMLASLPAEVYSDTWNPSLPLMPSDAADLPGVVAARAATTACSR